MGSLVDRCLKQFGLEKRPFALLPDPEFLFWSKGHEIAYSALEYGLETASPITVITGEVGAGKTTLMRHLLDAMPGELTVGLISNAQGGRHELLHWVLMSLGQELPMGAGYVELFHQFQQFLIAEYAAGRRTVLIFDEAQNLGMEMLEELRMLSNINADKDDLLMLVLVGQPELRDMIAKPELRQFAQRVGADSHLPALSVEDTANYVQRRLELAGATRTIFTPEAIEEIHNAARGVPRLINQLCEMSMIAAALSDQDMVGLDLARETIEFRRKQRSAAFAPPPPTAVEGEAGTITPLERKR